MAVDRLISQTSSIAPKSEIRRGRDAKGSYTRPPGTTARKNDSNYKRFNGPDASGLEFRGSGDVANKRGEEKGKNDQITDKPLNDIFVTIHKARRYFTIGRVFVIRWVEPVGSTNDRSIKSLHEPGFTKNRWFVVVRERLHSSLCLRLQTYGGQATTKTGCRPQDHTAVYKSGGLPKYHHGGEPGLTKRPLAIIVEDNEILVDPMTRINFSKVYTVEHNVKVRTVGRIPKEDLVYLENYFQQTLQITISLQDATLIEATNEKCFLVPYSQNPDFIGRTDVMERIHKSFEAESRVGLYGMGGVGKTQIAIQYCHQVKARNPKVQVFWINAATTTTFEEGYRNIAQRLNFAIAAEPSTETLKLVDDFLCISREKRWLMVLDNYDDSSPVSENGVKKHLQSLVGWRQGSLLVTSRDRQVALRLANSEKYAVYVDGFSTREASKLLLTKLGHVKSTETEQAAIAQMLGNNPLALTQVAYFMGSTYMYNSISEYVKRLQDDDGKIKVLYEGRLGATHGRDNDDSAITSLKRSFDHIRRINPGATELLSLMCVLDREAIPMALWKYYYTTEIEFDVATRRLFDLSLIAADDKRCSISVNTLVHLAVSSWLKDNNEFDTCMAKGLKLVSEAFHIREYGHSEICSALLPHALKLLEYKLPNIDQAQLLFNTAAYIRDNEADPTTAQHLQERSYNLYVALFQQEEHFTLNSPNELATYYTKRARFSDAETLLKQLILRFGPLLGPDHPEIRKSNANLQLSNQQRTQQSASVQDRWPFTRAKKPIFGDNAPGSLRNMKGMGHPPQSQGQHIFRRKIADLTKNLLIARREARYKDKLYRREIDRGAIGEAIRIVSRHSLAMCGSSTLVGSEAEMKISSAPKGTADDADLGNDKVESIMVENDGKPKEQEASEKKGTPATQHNLTRVIELEELSVKDQRAYKGLRTTCKQITELPLARFEDAEPLKIQDKGCGYGKEKRGLPSDYPSHTNDHFLAISPYLYRRSMVNESRSALQCNKSQGRSEPDQGFERHPTRFKPDQVYPDPLDCRQEKITAGIFRNRRSVVVNRCNMGCDIEERHRATAIHFVIPCRENEVIQVLGVDNIRHANANIGAQLYNSTKAGHKELEILTSRSNYDGCMSKQVRDNVSKIEHELGVNDINRSKQEALGLATLVWSSSRIPSSPNILLEDHTKVANPNASCLDLLLEHYKLRMLVEMYGSRSLLLGLLSQGATTQSPPWPKNLIFQEDMEPIYEQKNSYSRGDFNVDSDYVFVQRETLGDPREIFA